VRPNIDSNTHHPDPSTYVPLPALITCANVLHKCKAVTRTCTHKHTHTPISDSLHLQAVTANL